MPATLSRPEAGGAAQAHTGDARTRAEHELAVEETVAEAGVDDTEVAREVGGCEPGRRVFGALQRLLLPFGRNAEPGMLVVAR